jgi:CheY-like chemotaxis protein
MSVLLVEDNGFTRSLFTTVLRALGVDRIIVAEDGEQAIRILKPVQKTKSGQMVGHTGIDVVICDYYMPTVDGAMVLRWLRRSESSPDRFLPFLMVSAAADMETLVTSRDNGIDEFMSKPFSAEMLAQRLSSIAEHPRQHVFAPNYFGPDRRRRPKTVEKDRRVNTEADVEIVHSTKDVSALKNSDKKVWYFRLPRSLRQKLATGEAGPDSAPFDPALLEAAEAKIQDMEGDYADWVAETLDQLTQAQNRCIEDLDAATPHIAQIRRIALELRGQGGIFGYPLMTQFGKSLYEQTHEDVDITIQLLELVKAHIDLIRIVTKQKIKGDGGETGKQLMTSLSQAKKKFVGSKRPSGAAKPVTPA